MKNKPRPRLKQDEFDLLQQYRGLKQASDDVNIDLSWMKLAWIKTKKVSVLVTNPAYKSPEQKAVEFDLSGIIKKYVKPIKYTPNKIESKWLFDRLVYTDVHIGMNPNENGFSLYGGKWDEEDLMKSAQKMVELTLEEKKSNVLFIDDLGDLMDGWDGETVRKGHKLPQNMDNEKAFDAALKFKIFLLDALCDKYEKIICRNICNDNHSGSFGYVVNSSIKQFAEVKYSNVEVINQRKFLESYTYKGHSFILTHGKDSKALKFGFKPNLDKKSENKIDNFIKQNRIEGKIEFSKGDSHQCVFDDATSDTFSYYNYPALSPSSEWVQTNFQKGKRGFVFLNFKKDRKIINPYFFG